MHLEKNLYADKAKNKVKTNIIVIIMHTLSSKPLFKVLGKTFGSPKTAKLVYHLDCCRNRVY